MMFFLLSLIWGIVVVQSNPPAVGEASTKELAQQYINIVTSPERLNWQRFVGQKIGAHTVEETAEAQGVGTVYKTLLEDGTRQITLLVGEYMANIEAGLTYFRDLYNREFNKASRLPNTTTQPGQQASGWQDHVMQSSQDPNRVLTVLDESAKAQLRQYVSVTNEDIGTAMANANSITAVLHFVNSGLGMGSGQDPAVHKLFSRYQRYRPNGDPYETGILQEKYDALFASPDIAGKILSGAATAIVRIAKANNTNQQGRFTSYVLANAAPINCQNEGEWSKNVDSVIAAIQAVLEQTAEQLTVFLVAHRCGVFCNKPELVAKVYYSRLHELLAADRSRLKIVFPIPEIPNFRAFNEVLGSMPPPRAARRGMPPAGTTRPVLDLPRSTHVFK